MIFLVWKMMADAISSFCTTVKSSLREVEFHFMLISKFGTARFLFSIRQNPQMMFVVKFSWNLLLLDDSWMRNLVNQIECQLTCLGFCCTMLCKVFHFNAASRQEILEAVGTQESLCCKLRFSLDSKNNVLAILHNSWIKHFGLHWTD